MTRKEQKEERRKLILFTALNLFVTKGYHDTKITDIAKAADMSTGLLFHYFESKEALLMELVQMGVQGTQSRSDEKIENPEKYFMELLKSLFEYANSAPWVFQMFVLMGQVRRAGMPEEARKIALAVNQVEISAEIIKLGQEQGMFREGNPIALATCFWTCVQGIMEEIAYNDKMLTPEPEWIIAILKK